ncbi:hypothetical protein ABW19_dt0201694 [Dactylella cylindrospora]|nr:hypothetical protein ABW19_dt0201694 [Dactylella cylindrospora]
MGALDFLSGITSQWFFKSPSETVGCPHAIHGGYSGILPPEVVTRTATLGDLKFHAAASKQVQSIGEKVNSSIIEEIDLSGRLNNNLLVASPYTDANHLLDLDTLSHPNRLLAKALTIMNATTADYAIAPYDEAFNWDEVLEAVRKLSSREEYQYPRSEFYIIVFRSKLPFDADRENLGKLDEDAHVEAVESGQLLKYWFGTPHPETGRNLATCVWRHRDDAKRGGSGPGHVRAMEAVRGIYLEWRVERLKLIIEDNAAAWSIERWVD